MRLVVPNSPKEEKRVCASLSLILPKKRDDYAPHASHSPKGQR